MKKFYFLLIISNFFLASCVGNKVVKPSQKPAPPVASKPAPPVASAPTVQAPNSTNNADAQIGDNSKKPGGYYLDDGPEANPPQNLDSIPDATPKKEPFLARSNMPYKALGQTYIPMATSQDYKVRGLASWYGKRFHGKKTSSGEIYDMYGMTAAHTTLPLPSYAKVTNLANGRSVIVRINDRGPFKSTRIIDLSYAAAYKLRLLGKGSGMVEVETIHPENTIAKNTPISTIANTEMPAETATLEDQLKAPPQPLPVANEPKPVPVNQQVTNQANSSSATPKYFIQAGVFRNEDNAEALKGKIQSLQIEQNAGIYRVYNDGLHRILLGPYDTKEAAELTAADIRKRLNIAAIITNQ
ncbi:MAG: septal ring lytic transglycosylase RlpA family protein [Methylophilaceae bacterium]